MSTTIKYKGETVTSIEGGQTATLHLTDKKLTDDLIVEASGGTGESDLPVYNGEYVSLGAPTETIVYVKKTSASVPNFTIGYNYDGEQTDKYTITSTEAVSVVIPQDATYIYFLHGSYSALWTVKGDDGSTLASSTYVDPMLFTPNDFVNGVTYSVDVVED